jgi:hypothetical protein
MSSNEPGWVTMKRKSREVVLLEIQPSTETRYIRIAVGDPQFRGRIPLSIQADRDVVITREGHDETTED